MAHKSKTKPRASEKKKGEAQRQLKALKAAHSAAQRERARARKRHRAIMSEWIVIKTQHGRENWARINCERQGYKVLYLRVEKPFKAKLEPLFPGYLFVLPGEQGVAKLRSTFGVVGLVPSNEIVENVPLHVMRELLKMGDKQGIISERATHPLTPGELYAIGRGAFQGAIVRYIGLSADKRCELLLNMFGKDVKLTLPRDHVNG